IGEAETDEIALGLVDDRRRAELQHDGKAQLLGGAARRRAIRDEDLAGHRDAVVGNEDLGVVLGERGPRRRVPGGVHAARDHGGFCGEAASAAGASVPRRVRLRFLDVRPRWARQGGTRWRRQSGTEPYSPRATAARWWRGTATFRPPP